MSKVSLDMAQVEFDRFVEAKRIDMRLDGLDENDKRDKQQDRAIILRAIQDGALSVDDNADLLFTPFEWDGDPIKFGRVKGAALLAMDRKKESSAVAKLFAAMAEMTGRAESTFSKMDMADLKVCQSIAALFLA